MDENRPEKPLLPPPMSLAGLMLPGVAEGGAGTAEEEEATFLICGVASENLVANFDSDYRASLSLVHVGLVTVFTSSCCQSIQSDTSGHRLRWVRLF